jgi:O-antigen ligase
MRKVGIFAFLIIALSVIIGFLVSLLEIHYVYFIIILFLAIGLCIMDRFAGFLFSLFAFWATKSFQQFPLYTNDFLTLRIEHLFLLFFIVWGGILFLKPEFRKSLFENQRIVISSILIFLVIELVLPFFSTLSVRPLIPIKTFAWFSIYLISLYEINSSKKRELFMIALATFTVLASVFSIIEFVTKYNIFYGDSLISEVGFEESIQGLYRARFLFSHPNALGVYIAVILPFLIASAINNKGKLRVLYIITLSLLPVTLYTTFARNSWLAVFASLLFMAVSLFFIKKYSFMKIFLLAIPAAFIFANERLYKSIISRFRFDVGVSDRLILWTGLIKRFLKKPAFGYGPTSVPFSLSNDIIGRQMFAHNEFIRILSEYGIIGFIVYFTIFFGMFTGLIKAWFKEKNIYGLAGLTSMVAYLIVAMLTNPWEFTASFLFPLLAIGINSTKFES